MMHNLVNYPGSKNAAGLYQLIINTMPAHEAYCELYAGSAAIFNRKKRATINLLNDRSPLITHSLKSLYGPEALVTCQAAAIVINVLERSQKRWLIYADPPYVFTTRRSSRAIYDYEMTNQDHIELLNYACRSKHYWIISGYDCDLYNLMLPGWNKRSANVMTRAGKATESVWFNFPAPIELHDYAYLGKNFTDRQRIKRKKQRWLKNLQNMNPAERNFILSEINSHFNL